MKKQNFAAYRNLDGNNIRLEFIVLSFCYISKSMTQPSTARPLKNPIRAIVLTGLTAGFLDIAAASIQYYIKSGKGPGNVLRYIASGVFGKKAFAAGTTMEAWGLFFHLIIAFALTLFFFWLYPKISWLGKNIIVAGLLYGVFAWLVTNLIIVPLSKAPPIPFVFSKAIIAMLILMACVGMPISLMTNKHYLYKK
jgi:hypothetical protein